MSEVNCIPDFWWSPTVGLMRKNADESGSFTAFGGGAEFWRGICLPQQWPADAVQLAAEWHVAVYREERNERLAAFQENEARIKAALAVCDNHDRGMCPYPVTHIRAALHGEDVEGVR